MTEFGTTNIEGFPGVEAMPPAQAPRVDRGAVSSLVFGIAGIVPLAVFSIVALAAGHAAYGRIKRSEGALKGRTSAVVGAALGWLGTAWIAWTTSSNVAIFLAVWLAELAFARVIFVSLRPRAEEAPGDVPRRSWVALVGLASASLATVMALLGAKITATQGVILCLTYENNPCGLRGIAPYLFLFSMLMGSVAAGVLVAARREIRRAKPWLRGINLVRVGFVIALVGIIAELYLIGQNIEASLNSM